VAKAAATRKLAVIQNTVECWCQSLEDDALDLIIGITA
jgi:hypothetical protein